MTTTENTALSQSPAYHGGEATGMGAGTQNVKPTWEDEKYGVKLYLANKRHRVGEDNPLYKGGKTISHGYVALTSKKWGEDQGKYEHRVVMEKILGRSLSKSEVVHHINGNTTDNRPENLEILSRREHNRKHGVGVYAKCADCGKEKWYSPSVAAKLKPDYRCRPCSRVASYKKICKRCGSDFVGGRTAIFCGECSA